MIGWIYKCRRTFCSWFKKIDWSITNYYAAPEISISQDNISLIVLNQINKFIGIGNIYKDGLGGTVSILRITGINNINSFIHLFSTVKFHGSKALDFADFCKIIELINKKTHTTKDGINEIKKIVSNMNKKRLF
jgi:LAGLIDADG endonuclease